MDKTEDKHCYEKVGILNRWKNSLGLGAPNAFVFMWCITYAVNVHIELPEHSEWDHVFGSLLYDTIIDRHYLVFSMFGCTSAIARNRYSKLPRSDPAISKTKKTRSNSIPWHFADASNTSSNDLAAACTRFDANGSAEHANGYALWLVTTIDAKMPASMQR